LNGPLDDVFRRGSCAAGPLKGFAGVSAGGGHLEGSPGRVTVDSAQWMRSSGGVPLEVPWKVSLGEAQEEVPWRGPLEVVTWRRSPGGGPV
jgi:hypothetical protein